MMNPDDSLLAVLAQEYALLFDQFNVDYVGAMPGVHPPSDDPMVFHYFPASNLPSLPDFADQYQIPTEYESPGEISSPSLSPSPPGCAGDIDPAIISVEKKPKKSPKADLEGFERNLITGKWVCMKCGGDFVSTHEARRHAKTAAKCTGEKIECLRCGDRIHAEQFSRKRHFATKMCKNKGRKKGSPTYTLNNAFRNLQS